MRGMLIASTVADDGPDPMQYLFKATKAVPRAFMSIIALCISPWKRRRAA
jgi:hypothetical protein